MKASILTVILLALSSSSTVQAVTSRLELAEQAYLGGDFERAIEVYEQLLQEGYTNPGLFYNLGNSYYRAGERGQALASYFRAYEVIPRDRDLKHNIHHILQSNQSDVMWAWGISPVMQNMSLYGILSRNELVTVSLLFWGLSAWALGLLAMQRLQRLGRWGLLAIPCAIYFTAIAWTSFSLWPKWGAVSGTRAAIFSAPSEASGLTLFELHEGTPLKLKGAAAGWYLIEMPDRRRGWIASENLAVKH